MPPIEENPGTQPTVETQAPTTEINPLIQNTPTPAVSPVAPDALTQQPTTAWRDDWRQAIAGQDQKELARLQRFTDVPQIYKSFRDLENKQATQKFTPTITKDSTPEEVTAYRKAIGVPDKAEGYFEKLPDGMVIGDEDKGAMNLFANRLHELNTPPEVFNKVMETAFELIEMNQQEAVQAQMEIKAASRQKLYETWGPAEYKINVNAVANVLSSMPETLRNRFEGAQLADGTLMFNDVEAMQWWAQHVRENNPALGVMPAGTGDVVASIQKELDDNRNMMRTPSVWFAKDNAGRRDRHTQLLETMQKYERR